MREPNIDENDEVMDYELIADDDSMVLKNGKIVSVKTKDNIIFVLVEFIANNKLIKVNFYVDTTESNIEIELYKDDLIIVCENKVGFSWNEFYNGGF